MADNKRYSRRLILVTATLALIPVLGGAYRVFALDYRLADVLPQTRYDVAVDLHFDGHDSDAKVETLLPASDERQTILDERNSSPGLRFETEAKGRNRLARWRGSEVADGAHVEYHFSVLARSVRYDIDAALSVPSSYPTSVVPFLQPEPEIQVDDPEIRSTLRRIHADEGTVKERLQRIYELTSGLTQKPFKGTTDALTALRLGEASCNGKSRLFVALARASGVPAQLIGGLVMHPGSKRTSHQWVQAYVGGHWVPFDPTNHHFAELPPDYLTMYYGDEAMFRHTSDINFDYRFVIHSEMVPSPRAKTSFRVLNVWAMFERLQLPYSLLRTVLMLPVGALVVVLFRNVIGMPTYGTFLPALIAAAAGATGALWGLVGVLAVVLAVTAARWLVRGMELLHSPTLAILLTVVTVTLLGTSMLAERLGIAPLTRVSMFPIAVMAITAERFYLSLAEQGRRDAIKHLSGTMVVILACYVVMNSLALQVLLIGFPEALLWVVALNIYLGRWVGVRLSEYLRFHPLLFGKST